MKNYVTGFEYSGVNAATLAAAGVDSVVTFKQAIKSLGIPGAKLKGLKACAKLSCSKKMKMARKSHGSFQCLIRPKYWLGHKEIYYEYSNFSC